MSNNHRYHRKVEQHYHHINQMQDAYSRNSEEIQKFTFETSINKFIVSFNTQNDKRVINNSWLLISLVLLAIFTFSVMIFCYRKRMFCGSICNDVFIVVRTW